MKKSTSFQTLYSFILCTTIQQANGEIPREEMNFFLSGGLMLPVTSVDNPAHELLSEKSWDEIKRSSNLNPFENLPEDFMHGKASKWKSFADALNPEIEPLPQPWEKTLTDFQKLIVMRMIRPDKVIPKVRFWLIFSKILSVYGCEKRKFSDHYIRQKSHGREIHNAPGVQHRRLLRRR